MLDYLHFLNLELLARQMVQQPCNVLLFLWDGGARKQDVQGKNKPDQRSTILFEIFPTLKMSGSVHSHHIIILPMG